MNNYPAIFIITLAIFKGIGACNNATLKQNIEAIEVRDTSPMMGETFYRIFFLNDLVMYQSQYLFDSSINQLQVDSSTKEVINNVTLLSRQWRSTFLVFHKDSSYGYRYDPHRRDDYLRVGIDAASQMMKGTNRFDSFLAIKPDSTIWNVDKTELKEVYFFPEKKGMPTGRLGLSYSKKLNHLKESFNSTVDSVKKMKLFKTETIFDEFYSEKDKKVWPSMKYITEMREYTVENFEEIMTYFNRYKSSIGKKD